MRRLLFVCGMLAALAAGAQTQRPKITGIAGIQFDHKDNEKTRDFYSHLLGMRYGCIWYGDQYTVNSQQFLRFVNGHGDGLAPLWLEQEIFLRTPDPKAMRSYLNENGYKTSGAGDLVEVEGPEHLKIAFVPDTVLAKEPYLRGDPVAVSSRIIHAGFVVRDLAAAQKFFRDVLGFQLYWTGGPQWDGTEAHRAYMSMQVPDGREWVEFMLNRPADMDAKGYGAANHVAMGVPDIHEAVKRLRANGWTGTAEPKLGQDGKWQLNLFDPDGTRVELMEFAPSRPPCCTEYQLPHPSPSDR